MTQLTPDIFVSYWHRQALKEREQAERPDASPQVRSQYPSVLARLRLFEWLEEVPLLTEEGFVEALEGATDGQSSVHLEDASVYGIAREARALLRKWRDPDRDALQPYG